MSEQIAVKKEGSVGRILNALFDGLTYLSMFILVIIMLLVTADAFGRYLLNSPITGALEFTEEYLLVTATFMAIAYTYHHGDFVRVTFFVRMIPPKVRFILDHIVQAICALVSIVLLYAAIRQLQRVYEAHTTTISPYGYELWPAYAIVVLGMALLAMRVTADLLKVRRGQSALFKREEEVIPEDEV